MKSLWLVVVAGLIFSLLEIGTCQCDGEKYCMMEITRDSKIFYISLSCEASCSSARDTESVHD